MYSAQSMLAERSACVQNSQDAELLRSQWQRLQSGCNAFANYPSRSIDQESRAMSQSGNELDAVLLRLVRHVLAQFGHVHGLIPSGLRIISSADYLLLKSRLPGLLSL